MAEAGFYGKIPGFDDFLHRGLPSSFVEPWNAWVSQAVTASRATLGARWTEAYLTSPPWRFALEPGVLGDEGWLGILASSVDGVRRSYPIAIALPLPPNRRLFDLDTRIDPILDALEALVLQMIDGEADPDAATGRLEAITREAAGLARAPAILGRGEPERLMVGPMLAPVAALATQWLLEAGLRPEEVSALSAWWHPRWSERPAASLVTAAMPAADLFACFLDGGWANRGWTAASGPAEDA